MFLSVEYHTALMDSDTFFFFFPHISILCISFLDSKVLSVSTSGPTKFLDFYFFQVSKLWGFLI